MKIPDGGKPIEIGDPSFIYKGVYHPIAWMGNQPYRPRVEMLVIKDAHYVYLRLKDGIDKMPPDKRTHGYSIPGGSVDADSSRLEQAIAETNEEALIQVCLAYHSGIQYYELYEPGFLLKGGDMPIEYMGSVSDVYVGVYDGPYDKSKVEEKDLDEKMANEGKFHRISDVAKYLRKEHIQALLSSQFVATDEKINLQLYRMDNVSESTEQAKPSITIPNEENLIFHGSTYDIESFQPMSLDLGNVFEEPGWSTFCFATYDEAKLFGASRALTKLLEETYDGDGDSDEMQIIYTNEHLIISLECLNYIQEHNLMDMNSTFYVYSIDATNLNLGFGNDPALRECTFRESGVIPKKKDRFDLSFDDMKEKIEVIGGKIGDYNYPTMNEYSKLLTHNYQSEISLKSALQAAIKDGKLKPGDDVEAFMRNNSLEFESNDVALPELTIDSDEIVFEAVSIADSIMEETYPDDCYGLPDRKAYPMPDAKHVKSAIRFFNYVKPEEEKELASNINKNIRKFGLTDLNVGSKNRFKKYYKPVSETLALQDFLDQMKEVERVITSPEDSTSKKIRYMAYSKGKVLIQSLIDHASNGTITGMDDSMDVGHLINSAYATLAEINMNQMELMEAMEAKPIRTLSLYPIMEADDDGSETATDYTAMADEAEAGGGDVGTEDEPDTATDYTAMADEAEGETEEDTEDTGEEPTEDDGDEATDYTAMADEAEGDDTEGEDDSTDETDSSDMGDTSETEENDNNSNAYNNKEVKNYFLLNSYLSLHQTVNDVLDTVNGVILPTPEANNLVAKMVKNLQDVRSFIEKFIQFQFSDTDYAFNLYYYNILLSALRMNLELFETTASMGTARKNKEKEE